MRENLDNAIEQLDALVRDKPPGWDLKALYLTTNLMYGSVETYVASIMPVLRYRARVLRHERGMAEQGWAGQGEARPGKAGLGEVGRG